MSAKKVGDCPKPKEKKIRSECPYCTQGYIVVGEADGKLVTVECGYCLGTGFRSIK
jgi:hypothetical protein